MRERPPALAPKTLRDRTERSTDAGRRRRYAAAPMGFHASPQSFIGRATLDHFEQQLDVLFTAALLVDGGARGFETAHAQELRVDVIELQLLEVERVLQRVVDGRRRRP